MAQKRINISLSLDVIDRIDKLAQEDGMNRSAIITMAFNQYMQQREATSNLPQMAKMMEELKELAKKVEEQQIALPLE